MRPEHAGGMGGPRLIDRGDLVVALEEAAAGKVTIISAPAGSGKTLLLRAWACAGRLRRLAVVQVQRDQRDGGQFWAELLGAVGRACAAAGGADASAAAGLDGLAMADRVLSVLAGAGADITLVIDDLHELTSPGALAQLTWLLANLPGNVHAVLSTRHDLRLGLHRLRLAGELAEIRAADLRFSERETRELLAAWGIALSDAGAALLHQRTEGWAAGLGLAALSLAGHRDPERFVAEFSGSDRTVAEYLIAELLERQPGEVRDLLLRTSLLDRVNGELADLLTGRPGSERILLALEDANAFVVSLDGERTWFRYHHLLADLLRLELRRALPEHVPALHRRAAGWFIGHGQAADAIRHTQAAGDWPQAARLLADHSFTLTMDGQAQTVRALLRAFPPGAPADNPELALVRAGYNLARGRLDEAAAHLAVFESHAATTPPGRQRRLQVAITSLKLSLATRRGHLAGVTEHAALLACPPTAHSGQDIALDRDLRAVTLMNLGTIEAFLGLTHAERHLQEGAALARETGRPYLEARCLAQLGLASSTRPLATIRQRCQEAITLAGHHGWAAEPWIAPAQLTLAANLAWTGQFDHARQWLHRAEQTLHTDTGPDISLLIHIVKGMLHACHGRHHDALAAFSTAEHLGSQLADPHALASQLTAWTLAAQARAGQPAQARASLTALDDHRATTAELANARAVISLAEHDPAAALAAVHDIADGTTPPTAYPALVETHLLTATAHHHLGNHPAANQATEHALALAEPDRLILPFAMTHSAHLLQALPRHHTAHAALLADILDVLHGNPPASPDDLPPPAHDLSPSELKVLRYLPTNLSRTQIAGELSLSLNTVNTHVRRIYAKLGADDRSSAVHRARKLRLLSGGRAH